MNREFRFYQEHPSGRWYVDLPEWEGDKADLEMVMGADSFLTIMSEGNDEVRLILSDEKIEGADFLVLKEMGLFEEIEVGSGAWYILPKYMGIDYDHSMWLCDVTLFVFGYFPETIWFVPIRM